MKKFRWLGVGVLCMFLMAIRGFETQLFYDPLLAFFKSDFRNIAFPQIDMTRHMLSISFRYFINTLISAGIIYLLFLNKEYVKVFVGVMLVLWIAVLGLYYYFVATQFGLGFTAGFYVRRMLLQPIFLLLFVPAFWYLQKKESQEQ